jgi:hypothetical protein
VLDEIKVYHEQGKRAPQLEIRANELKAFLLKIMNKDEVDPRNEWSIKAHQLLA